ncbi:HAD family hydrolase [Xylocopilactobacillus apicola]|uniref:Sugar-phosphatase n=1 Tax=Xylocopilactobacillus apicola TaxID=2932184 RepID=A0AAU9DXR9_9LACO|nr:HAD family hydrolase [Xylocopilactobacillus apicola]BDR58923.1 sugar-phosphatase [Xylocopilactobacillus apicola]
MPIKLIATDIDGTFIKRNQSYDRRKFKELLQELNKRQIYFVVATGSRLSRPQKIFAPFADQLYYVVENGAEVVGKQGIIAEDYIPREAALKIIEILKDDPKFSKINTMISGTKSGYITSRAHWLYRFVIRHLWSDVVEVEDFKNIDDNFYNISLHIQNELVSYLRDLVGEHVDLVTSGRQSLDIHQKGVNKSTGLTKLLTKLQIDPSEVAAFGDNYNDLEMLESVKYSFAMDNAVEKIKQVSLEVVPSNNEQGVLKTIEQILAGKYD